MTDPRHSDPSQLLTTAEVAWRFRVDTKTVTRWTRAGKLTAIRTPGGQRRYRLGDIEALLTPREDTTAASPSASSGGSDPE